MKPTNKASGDNLLSGDGTVSSARQAAGLRSAVEKAELWRCVMLPPVPLLPLFLLFTGAGNAILLLLPSPAGK